MAQPRTPPGSAPKMPSSSPSKAAPAANTQDEPADDAEPVYTHFAHREQVETLLERVLAIDVTGLGSDEEEESQLRLYSQLTNILDYYLPMPGLLDPALDDIVPPLMDLLGTQLANLADGTGPQPNPARLARIGRLVNWVVKVRGWKAVVPYFPSTLPHLNVLIKLLSPPTASGSRSLDLLHHPAICGDDAWELRAVLLLWLALLLTVPFSLSALSDAETPTYLDIPTHKRLFSAPTSDLAVRVTLLSVPLLHRPGREGSYAALVLARLFARDDAVQGLPGFLSWAGAELAEGEREREASIVASLLNFLALLPSMIATEHLPLLAEFLDDAIIPHLAGGVTAATSGLIRKLAVKARGRWWLARLGRGLRNDPDADLPDGIEDVLDDLMSGLGDKDTIVRYSAAKYLARIAALLPEELSEQIVMATIALYAGTDDEPVVESKFDTIIDPGGSAAGRGAMGLGGVEATRGEARWHGVCLAVAELARRGLLSTDAVAEVVPWAIKALTFDLRRGSHSIGSNVRDAASYVLWSLSRAATPDQLRLFADHMATSLIAVAVFDREVGVRRAASAAFQEGVGRLGMYPEGIDVLGKTDFYSVSVRRKAFTVAAPAVATHKVYRDALRDHLHNITLRHWDAAMRTAGAAALAELLRLAPDDVADSVERELAYVTAIDLTSAHGALVALAHIAPLLDDGAKESLVAALTRVRAAALITTYAAEIISAGCTLAGAALTSTADLAPIARFFEAAARRREADVHEALAEACRRISEIRPNDAAAYVAKSVKDLSSSRAAQRQANALCLGQYIYPNRGAAGASLAALLYLLDPAAKADVETRRNAVRSLADIAGQREADGDHILNASDFQQIVAALTVALDDYTTDQRGDVGSWIRSTAIKALARIFADIAHNLEAKHAVPEEAFSAATAGIAKQAFEKLDVLREAATDAWKVLLDAKADLTWEWPAARCMEGKRSAEWFTSGLDLLATPARTTVLAGLVQSAGSTARAISQRALTPLLTYLHAAPPQHVSHVVSDIVALLASSFSSNRVAIPALTTLARLIDANLADPALHGAETPYLRALALATRGVPTLKSIDRITAAMRVVVASLSLPASFSVRAKAVDALPAFLGHRFPRIRSITSEALYLHLSELDEIPAELEEALLETSWAEEEGVSRAPEVAELLKGVIDEL